MLAFEVSINGERVCIAGVADPGTMTAMLTWVRRDLAKCSPGVPLDEEELRFEVGGRTASDDLRWLDGTVTVDDIVEIRVVDVEHVDVPSSIVHDDPVEERARQREWAERVLRGETP